MPLMNKSSKKAFKHNIEAEMHAGKPKDQALAIAYNVKRTSGKQHKAYGGAVEHLKRGATKSPHHDMDMLHQTESHDSGCSDIQCAEGGHIMCGGHLTHPTTTVDIIMAKRKAKADGGEVVDIEENEEEEPNQFYKLDKEAVDDEDEEEEDPSVSGQIRKKMKSKK